MEMTDRIQGPHSQYECVEPELGELLWRRLDPGLEPDLRSRLQDHLSICDACRLTLLVEGRIEGGLRAGEWALEGGRSVRPATGSRTRKSTVFAGGLALAASLVLMLILPPAARAPLGVVRGDTAGMGFVRPVESEVLVTSRPDFRWTPIAGATAYRIEVSQVDGPWFWSGRTGRAELRLPAESALPPRGSFRAMVQTIPADLSGLADVTVSFRRGAFGAFLSYRAAASPLWVKFLACGGLALLTWWGLTGWDRRRRLAN